MTYEEYVDALNAHADQCDQCRASRKIGSTASVCQEGRNLIDQYKDSAAARIAAENETPDKVN